MPASAAIEAPGSKSGVDVPSRRVTSATHRTTSDFDIPRRAGQGDQENAQPAAEVDIDQTRCPFWRSERIRSADRAIGRLPA